MNSLQVLDNGLLVDPHDQQSVANALLKLVADKQLWGRCRQNGLKNIHLFSWPEHCKTYLARIACCRQRSPEWQKPDDGYESSGSDSPRGSLRDIQDLSLNLKLSVGDEKNVVSCPADSYLDFEEKATDGNRKIEAAVSSSKGISIGTQKVGSIYKSEHHTGSGKSPALRKRKRLFVIAVDGNGKTDLLESIKMVVETIKKDKSAGSIGFILSTSLAISEIHSLLLSGGLSHSEFDAFICNSGTELYYPSSSSASQDGPHGLPFLLDSNYHSHIEYRWGGEDLQRTLLRWAASTTNEKGGRPIVSEDKSASTTHCYVFKVEKPDLVKFCLIVIENNGDFSYDACFYFYNFQLLIPKCFSFLSSQTPTIKELRKSMRIQALRCHVIYCQNGNKLNVIPVMASRSQALRYVH